MPKEHYIASLDIGTHSVRVVQAKVSPEGELSVIGASSVVASGMRRGTIVDIEEVVSTISAAVEKAERMTGVPVTHVNVSVGGNHIVCMDSKGVIAVSRADGEISEHDVVRVIDASQAISIPPNREVIHVIPKTFTLDGQTGIKDPIGMSGIRLEVETVIIHGAAPFLKNLQKAIAQAGLEVDQLVLAPLAASQAVLTKRQKDLGVALVDLGAGTTSLAVYEESNLLHTAVIPVGAMHVTNDIAIGLRCGIETAERVKLLVGQASHMPSHQDTTIDLSELHPDEHERVSQKMVTEIIEPRLEEIFDLVQKELRAINRDGKLPAGVVLTGGGAQLPGIVEMAKHRLRLPVHVGTPQEATTIIDQVASPVFATAVGLILWGSKFGTSHSSGGFGKAFSGLASNQTMLQLKRWFNSFLP
jgi:cell division protein FtsA